jgi:hypothetical protein
MAALRLVCGVGEKEDGVPLPVEVVQEALSRTYGEEPEALSKGEQGRIASLSERGCGWDGYYITGFERSVFR